MNRKFIAAAFLFFATSALTFAVKDSTPFSINAGISFPQIFNFHPSPDGVERENYSAIGINVGARAQLFGIKIGFFADTNLYFPLLYKQKIDGTTYSYNRNDGFNSAWGFDTTVGVYTPIFALKRFSIPLGIGLHINFSNNKTETESDESAIETEYSFFSLGFGAFVNFDFRIGKSFSIYCGLRFAWDFFQNTSSKEYEKNSNNNFIMLPNANNGTRSNKPSITSIIFVTPALGAMLKF